MTRCSGGRSHLLLLLGILLCAASSAWGFAAHLPLRAYAHPAPVRMAASTLGQIPLWRRLRTGLSPNYVHQHHHQHDEITFRDRMGQPLSIPQAERYSGRDWWHNLLTLPTSIILHRIRMPILWQMLWAAGVVLLHTFRPITCSMKPHTLLGSALGLLLVFRTNAGYNRMWEGRKIWENVVNKSRDMARFCDLYRDDLGEERILRIGKLLAVFPLILEEHLKGFKDTSMYKHLLAKNELQELEQTRYNRPLYIVDLLGKEARAIAYSESWSSRERLALIDMVHKFSNYVGACERLVSEPVPLHYVRHTSRMLSLWCFSLPFVCVGDMGLSTILVSAVSTWALFGIQEIGLLIEDPFQHVLHLNVFSSTIYTDVQHQLFPDARSPAMPSLAEQTAAIEDHQKTSSRPEDWPARTSRQGREAQQPAMEATLPVVVA